MAADLSVDSAFAIPYYTPMAKQEPLPGEITKEEAARRLEAAIKAKGQTIYALAQQAGIERARLWEWATKGKVPSWTRLMWLIEKLDLDPNLILPLSVRKKISKKS